MNDREAHKKYGIPSTSESATYLTGQAIVGHGRNSMYLSRAKRMCLASPRLDAAVEKQARRVELGTCSMQYPERRLIRLPHKAAEAKECFYFRACLAQKVNTTLCTNSCDLSCPE
jgi:hypothetical protein